MANVKQAPSMMQTSALAGQEPDLYAQQLDLQRRQQYADMLRKQAATAIDPNRVAQGGVAFKISPWEGLAKMAQAYLARSADKSNDEDQVKIGSVMAQRQAAALKALAPAGTFDDDAPIDLSGKPQASTPENYRPPVDSNIKQAWIRALKVSESNPELGSKLIQNLSEVTNDQKNWAAQGLNPRDVGSAEMGKLKAGGLVNVAPNNTVLDASTQKPVFAAPDFNSGRQNTFGPNGVPQISPMQGSELIPQQAGQVKRAEAAGAAGYDMVTVNTPNGPVMMTREQAAQQANPTPQSQPAPQMPQQATPQAPQGAQPANQGFPAGTQMPAMTGAATPENRMAILQQERQQMVARNATPADLQMIDREIAGVSRAGVPAMSASLAGVGIPLKPSLDTVREEAQAKADAAVYEKRQQTYRDDLDKTNKQYDEMMAALPSAREALKVATGSGIGSMRDTVQGVFGKTNPAAKAAASLDVIGAKFTSNVPRFEGPQSDKDTAFYKAAAGDLANRNVPNETRMAALDTVESMQKYANAIANGRQAPEPAWRQTGRYRALGAQQANPTQRRSPAPNSTPEQIMQFYLGGNQ